MLSKILRIVDHLKIAVFPRPSLRYSPFLILGNNGLSCFCIPVCRIASNWAPAAGRKQDKTKIESCIKRTPEIDAILFLMNCQPKPFSEKAGLIFFREVATDAGISDAESLDRYCLRHTPLTWLSRTLMPQREICDMAGHMTLRMLDEHYAWRRVKDQREWSEAMPLSLAKISKGWHGFLLECFLLAKWPSLSTGSIPNNDSTFNSVMEILRAAKGQRKELVLF